MLGDREGAAGATARGGSRSGRRGALEADLGGVLHIDAHLGHPFHALECLTHLPSEGGVILRVQQQGDTHLPLTGRGDITDLLRLVE